LATVAVVAGKGRVTVANVLTATSVDIRYVVTNSSGCVDSASITININPLPSTGAIVGSGDVCVGATNTITLTNPTAPGGKWRSANVSYVTIGETTGVLQGIAPTPSSVKIWYITTDAGTSCQDSISKEITVYALPTPTINTSKNPAGISLCVNGTVQLNGSPTGSPYNAEWITTNSAVATVSGGLVTAVSAGNAVIKYKVTNSTTNCVDSAWINITVNPLPTVTAGATKNPICSNDKLNLTSTAGYVSYVWSGPATVPSVQDPSDLSPIAGEYTVTVTDGNGCTNTSSVTISVTTLPVVNDFTYSSFYCNSETNPQSPTVSGAANTGGAYTSTPPGLILNSSTGAVTPSGSTEDTYTVTYTVPAANGCSAVSKEATVVIAACNNLTLSKSANKVNVCVGDSVTFEIVVKNNSANALPLSVVQENWDVTHFEFRSATPTPLIGTFDPATKTWTIGSPYNLAANGTITLTVVLKAILPGVEIENQAWIGAGSWPGITDAEADARKTTVNARSKPKITAPASICEGETLSLFGDDESSVSGATYSWLFPDGTTSPDKNPVINNITLAKSGVYTLYITTPGTCTDSIKATITVNARPVITIGGNTPVCQDSTLHLTSSGGGTYAWTGPLGWVSSLQNPDLTNMTSANAGQYNVEVTNSLGCKTSESITIGFTPEIKVTTFYYDGNPFCATITTPRYPTVSGTNLPTGVPGDGVFSSPDGLLINPLTGEFTPSANAIHAADTFTVIYTIPAAYTDGCGDVKGTTKVIVTKKPDITSFYYAGVQPFCKSEDPIGPSITVNPVVSHTGVFSYTAPGKHLQIDPSTGVINFSLSDTGTYEVTYQMNASGGCTGDPKTTTVSIKNCTSMSLLKTAPTAVCKGHNIEFTLVLKNNSPIAATDVVVTDTLPSGFTYVNSSGYGYTATNHQFTVGPVAAGEEITLTITATANTVGGPVFNYAYVSKVNADEYDSYANAPNILRGNAPVTINDNPTAVIINPTSTDICAGSTLELEGDGAGSGGSYKWRSPDGTIWPVQNKSIANISSANAGTYWLITTNDSNCQDSTSITIVVKPKPTAVITSPSSTPVSICAGSTLTLAGDGAGTGGSYAWSGPSFSSNLQSTEITTVTTAATGRYKLIVTTVDGCEDSTFVEVTVNELPNFDKSSNTPVCVGTSLNLTLTITDPANYSYAWTGPGTLTNPTTTTPSISVAAATDEGWYKVTVTNTATNCQKTDSTYVTIEECTNLTLTKTADVSAVCNGNDVLFTIKVTNNASSPAAGVIVVDTLPSGFRYDHSHSPNGGTTAYSNTSHKWILVNEIPAGESDSLKITVIADTVGTITNKAYIAKGGAVIDNNSYDEADDGHKGASTVTVVRKFIAPDIRVDVCPAPGRSIHLTKFLDSLNYSNVTWAKVTSSAPAITSPEGTINSAAFYYHSTYTYQYTYNTSLYSIECGTTSARAYVQSLTNRLSRKIDTVVVCRHKELSAFINLNQLFGMEFGGASDIEGWLYDNTVNPTGDVVSKVKVMAPPSIWAGSRIFDAIAAWNDITNSSYNITYKGDANAKKFIFRYTPQSGSCIGQSTTIVIIVTDKMF
jgi:uncharacterized repeat protein (TIGR01451 family)